MYNSLLTPWSPPHLASPREATYRAHNLQRTKGTIFLLPPPQPTLESAYRAPPRAKSRMSAGAVALCKHFERGGAAEHARLHPYWALPAGGNDAKTRIAEGVLQRMLDEVVWRNVMLLHRGVAVYEVRNARGWGMRWGLDVVCDDDGVGGGEGDGMAGDGGDRGGNEISDLNSSAHQPVDTDCPEITDPKTQQASNDLDEANRPWRIVRTTFRGFVEPIEGMDHELDGEM